MSFESRVKELQVRATLLLSSTVVYLFGDYNNHKNTDSITQCVLTTKLSLSNCIKRVLSL